MFVIEFGVNHLGKIEYLNKMLNFYLNSSFKMATLMIHNKEYYDINPKHKIERRDYVKVIKRCKQKGKKIGLSVCDLETFNYVKDLNFDFYKLLSISNINKELIEGIKKKKKHVYISTGLSNDKKIKKSVKLFKNYKRKTFLHTPMTYNSKNLNFKRINELKNMLKKEIGYSNHNNNLNTIYALSSYLPKIIFIYTKPIDSYKLTFPDNDHAFHFNKLEEIKRNYIECLNSHKKNNKSIRKTNIFK